LAGISPAHTVVSYPGNTPAGTVAAILLAFFAAGNGGSAWSLRLAIRTLVAFLRTLPDLAWAMMFVMAFGIGPLAGTLA
jgi:phosphonate transport system permease protein